MINKINAIGIATVLTIMAGMDGYALSYNVGDFDLSLSGYGTAGIIEPNLINQTLSVILICVHK